MCFALLSWSRLCWLLSHKKLFVITYLLEDEQELSLGMLIRLKRINNFWVIHASFVILSHIFTINYIIFMHFVGLTYWQDAKCQFPVIAVFVFQKSHNRKYRRIALKIYGEFLCKIRHHHVEGQPGGPPRGQGWPPAAGPPRGAGGTRPYPLGTSTAPSDAYKTPFDLKPRGRPLFSTNSTPTRRHRKP